MQGYPRAKIPWLKKGEKKQKENHKKAHGDRVGAEERETYTKENKNQTPCFSNAKREPERRGRKAGAPPQVGATLLRVWFLYRHPTCTPHLS